MHINNNSFPPMCVEREDILFSVNFTREEAVYIISVKIYLIILFYIFIILLGGLNLTIYKLH